jgi:ribosomal protein L32
MDSLIIYLIVLIVMTGACALIGSKCGASRGRETAGMWLGILLGPLGCIIALFLPPAYADNPRRSSHGARALPANLTACPMCGKLLPARSKSCPDCGSALGD